MPPQGIKLTPRHYAYLKISEGCNHRCSFCIIPSMRGDLVSRPIGEVMQEAENLVQAGVRELLVISQDTSAYGVDVKYRTGFWRGRPLKTRMTELCRALGELGVLGAAALRLSVSARRRGDSADGRGQDPAVPRRAVPARAAARILKLMKRPASAEKTSSASRAGARAARTSRCAAPSSSASRARPRPSSSTLLEFLEAAQLDRVGCFAYSPVDGAAANALPDPVPETVKEERRARFMRVQQKISERKLRAKVGRTMKVLVDAPGIGRSAADAPEIDGTVRFRGGKPGEFADVVIDRASAHDLHGRLARPNFRHA